MTPAHLRGLVREWPRMRNAMFTGSEGFSLSYLCAVSIQYRRPSHRSWVRKIIYFFLYTLGKFQRYTGGACQITRSQPLLRDPHVRALKRVHVSRLRHHAPASHVCHDHQPRPSQYITSLQ